MLIPCTGMHSNMHSTCHLQPLQTDQDLRSNVRSVKMDYPMVTIKHFSYCSNFLEQLRVTHLSFLPLWHTSKAAWSLAPSSKRLLQTSMRFLHSSKLQLPPEAKHVKQHGNNEGHILSISNQTPYPTMLSATELPQMSAI